MRCFRCLSICVLTFVFAGQIRAQELLVPLPDAELTPAEIAKREADVARREAEIAKREAALAGREIQSNPHAARAGIVSKQSSSAVGMRNQRLPRQLTHDSPAMGTPLPRLQELRHEKFGVPIRKTNVFPGPQDPNDHQNHVAHGTSSLRSYNIVPFWRTPEGLAAYGSADPRTLSAEADAAADAATTGNQAPDPNDPTIDFSFQMRPGILFDSGNANGPKVFNPGTIALNGSKASHQNGQTFFIAPNGTNGANGFIIPFRTQAGYNIADAAGVGSAAIHADMISTNGADLRLRTGALRYLNTTEELGVGFGQMETLFGDLGSAPTSIMTGALPVGTVSAGTNGFTGIPQLRVSRYWHNAFADSDIFEAAISVEDPRTLSNNISTPDAVIGSTILNRYPTVAGRLRYGGSNGFDSYQVAGLVVPLGFENAKFHESFATAYGISANARFEIGDCDLTDTIYLGAVAGRGIGGYIFGTLPGAFVTVTNINLVNNVGAYASYRHVWAPPQNGSFWSSNFMGGLAQAGNTNIGKDNRQLYQAGCNLLWHKGMKTTVGLEYQYASREAVIDTKDGNAHHGEDHRIMFVLQFALDPSLTSEGRRSVAAQTSDARAAAASDFNAAASDPSSSAKSRMRF